jgi:ribosomal protein L3 glutamine methyltransferase
MPKQPPDYFQAAYDELGTARDILRFAVSRFNEANLFFGHGSATAFDEAVYLILHTLHLPLDNLDPFVDATLTRAECSKVLKIIERRVKERLPAAYLTHEAWLGPHRFYVDANVIVPRSFIAEMLHENLHPWILVPDRVKYVLDLCTGSGCLAILAALSFPNATVDAVDLSADALKVAARNVNDYELNERVQLVESDMFAKLKGRKYDVIISNPPYVTAESMAGLPQEYLHEPRMALASGTDGLDHVRIIMEAAPKFLNKNGLLIIEAGFNREGVEEAFSGLPLTWVETSVGGEVVFLVTREELVST